MKKLLLLLLIFSSSLFAQRDLTGNLVSGTNPTWAGTMKVYLFTPKEELLNLPSPASVSGQIIKLKVETLASYARLNQIVVMPFPNPIQTYVAGSYGDVYLYSNGIDFYLYFTTFPTPAIAALAAACTTVVNQKTDYTITAGDFGKYLRLGTTPTNFVLPTLASITPYQTFTIINQSANQVCLPYSIKVDRADATTRFCLAMNEGGNILELYSDGTQLISITK